MPAVANVSVNIVTGPAAAKLKALNGNLKTTNTALKGTAASSAAASTGLAGVGVAAAKSLGPLIFVCIFAIFGVCGIPRKSIFLQTPRPKIPVCRFIIFIVANGNFYILGRILPEIKGKRKF